MSFSKHPILFEDADLVLVDKPAGVLSHPNPGAKAAPGSCAFEGKYDFNAKTFATPSGTLWLLHRLDQDTSGVLLAARTEKAARALREAFDAGRVAKHYLALVRGIADEKGVWRDHLESSREGRGGRDGSRVRTRVVRGRAANAELKFVRREVFAAQRVSLLEIELVTGRTHQIRVQAASRQHPIAGDDLYGDFAWNKRLRKEWGLKRLFLHAASLEFVHPGTRRRVCIESALPGELERVKGDTSPLVKSVNTSTPC
ncbi:MAG: RluA family pseudouridine synthase [Oligoflexia bacterium]